MVLVLQLLAIGGAARNEAQLRAKWLAVQNLQLADGEIDRQRAKIDELQGETQEFVVPLPHFEPPAPAVPKVRRKRSR